MVSQKDAPRNWDDFLDPKWKGKIGMDQEEYEWYAASIHYWGNERAQKFHRALAKQGIHWNRGHTMVSQLMAAGEFPLGIVYAHRVESMKKSGASIEWAKTADPVFVNLSPVAVAAKAHHPNAAKLLMDFILSKEAQLCCETQTDRLDGSMSNRWCRRCTPAGLKLQRSIRASARS